MKQTSRKRRTTWLWRRILVFEYLKGTTAAGTDVTAADIAAALGIEKKSVDGSVTSALQRKGLAVRTKAEVEVTDEAGKTTHKEVKFITLTDAGMAFDPDAEVAPAAAE